VRAAPALLAALAVLVAAPAAAAQGQVIRAVEEGTSLRWEPGGEVAVDVGATVTWTYDGSQLAHNVKSESPNWSVDTPSSTTDPRPVSFTFTTEGTYKYVCKFHADTMVGQIKVGNPPPPPPPPPSEQPFPNDQQPPEQFEVGDRKRPRVGRLRVRAVRNGARLRFRLSERARVTVRFRLAGITVKTARRTFRAGQHRLTVRDRRMHGRFRVELFARDAAGNRSRLRHAQVTVR
jgi:plastocyanin